MTVSEAYPHLQLIAKKYELRLNVAREFKMVRLILKKLYQYS